jgi:hypothetical protein
MKRALCALLSSALGVPDWAGYFGAPRLASAAIGAADERDAATAVLAFALRVLDGFDPSTSSRYSRDIVQNPAVAAIVKDTLAREAATEARHQEWRRGRAAAAAARPSGRN